MWLTLEASKASEIEGKGGGIGNLWWFGRERVWIGGDLGFVGFVEFFL